MVSTLGACPGAWNRVIAAGAGLVLVLCWCCAGSGAIKAARNLRLGFCTLPVAQTRCFAAGMPKKRQHLKSFKPTPTASPASGASSNAAGECELLLLLLLLSCALFEQGSSLAWWTEADTADP